MSVKCRQILSENDILPVNVEVNNKIAQLRAKWTCHAADRSDYCYVSRDDKVHIPLGNLHFTTWAAACVCRRLYLEQSLWLTCAGSAMAWQMMIPLQITTYSILNPTPRG
jgi:hypothetical protein